MSDNLINKIYNSGKKKGLRGKQLSEYIKRTIDRINTQRRIKKHRNNEIGQNEIDYKKGVLND